MKKKATTEGAEDAEGKKAMDNGRKTMGKVRKLVVVINRGGAMDDERLMASLAVDYMHPVLAAVREIIDRAEDDIDHEFCGMDVSREARADAGIAKAAVRRLRETIEGLRVQACEKKN
jgi:hypothetical protein